METGYINLIAEQTARHLGIEIIPTFGRWNKHGGHAKKRYYGRQNVFTLPLWLVNENNFYRIAYIVHEVCHFVSGAHGHNKAFYDAERLGLAVWDMEPHYRFSERYLHTLTLLGTKVPLWTKVTAKTKLRRTRLSRGESR